MSTTIAGVDPKRLARMLDQQEIRDVYYRYCRGVDRRQYDMIRSCYHPDGTDNHGEFVGDVDGFIEHVKSTVVRFERTMHFLGNILIEVDGDQARGEAYAFACHRLAASRGKPQRDFTVALRYVDDFERRNGEWRIAHRICVFEWSRMDPVGDNRYQFPATAHHGRADLDDPVFAPSLADL